MHFWQDWFSVKEVLKEIESNDLDISLHAASWDLNISSLESFDYLGEGNMLEKNVQFLKKQFIKKERGNCMRFLVTNDDGVFSPGLSAIVEALQKYGEVNVVCPNQEKSAAGHSITLLKPLYVNETTVFGENVKAWTVNGTPADCVKMALEVLLPNAIDFVVSGMNMGSNTGRDIYYSGTIAGAREASFFNIPAIAVSLDIFNEDLIDFRSSKKLFSNVLETILSKQFTSDLLLNINIPHIDESLYKGIRFAELDYSIHQYKLNEVNEPSGPVYYLLKDYQTQLPLTTSKSDIILLQQGFITVTPLEVRLTDQNYKSEIEHWFKESDSHVSVGGSY